MRATHYLIESKYEPGTFLGAYNEDTEKREYEDLEGAVRFADKQRAANLAIEYSGRVVMV